MLVRCIVICVHCDSIMMQCETRSTVDCWHRSTMQAQSTQRLFVTENYKYDTNQQGNVNRHFRALWCILEHSRVKESSWTCAAQVFFQTGQMRCVQM